MMHTCTHPAARGHVPALSRWGTVPSRVPVSIPRCAATRQALGVNVSNQSLCGWRASAARRARHVHRPELLALQEEGKARGAKGYIPRALLRPDLRRGHPQRCSPAGGGAQPLRGAPPGLHVACLPALDGVVLRDAPH
eukprot:822546-Prymnesium_polylepis.1